MTFDIGPRVPPAPTHRKIKIVNLRGGGCRVVLMGPLYPEGGAPPAGSDPNVEENLGTFTSPPLVQVPAPPGVYVLPFISLPDGREFAAAQEVEVSEVPRRLFYKGSAGPGLEEEMPHRDKRHRETPPEMKARTDPPSPSEQAYDAARTGVRSTPLPLPTNRAARRKRLYDSGRRRPVGFGT